MLAVQALGNRKYKLFMLYSDLSTGVGFIFTTNALAFLKCLHPEYPRLADNGEACRHSSTQCTLRVTRVAFFRALATTGSGSA